MQRKSKRSRRGESSDSERHFSVTRPNARRFRLRRGGCDRDAGAGSPRSERRRVGRRLGRGPAEADR
jgi:hypothetical protein